MKGSEASIMAPRKMTLSTAEIPTAISHYAVSSGFPLVFCWELLARDVDCGPPEEVKECLAQCISEFSAAVFMRIEEDATILPVVANFSNFDMDGISGLWKNNASKAVLAKTPDQVLELFDCAGFSFELQAQVVILMHHKSQKPERTFVLELLHTSSINIELISKCGARGIMYPGVDGDFACFVFIDEQSRQEFIDIAVKHAEGNFELQVTEKSALPA